MNKSNVTVGLSEMEHRQLIAQFDVNHAPLISIDKKHELHVAIASLSIGGAERIVLDWAARIHPQWKVHLIVLRSRETEWSVPDFVRVTRLDDPKTNEELGLKGTAYSRRMKRLELVGQEIAASPNPVCVCHLMKKDERDVLLKNGARIVSVLHNAKDGWAEDTNALEGSMNTVAVSTACANELREHGWSGPLTTIKHIPPAPYAEKDARKKLRKKWNIPENAFVMGMIGAVKPQKNYDRALEILQAMKPVSNAYLAIIGGPVSKDGPQEWKKLVDKARELNVLDRLALPGFIQNGSQCLPAFDVVLNTSHFEGLSIATLEAMATGMPVIATKVGGQGEITSPNLHLLQPKASNDEWVDAIIKSLGMPREKPSWTKFSSYKLWTSVGLAHDFVPTNKVLFVTANLNLGGAQRSLYNLALSLNNRIPFSIALAGLPTSDYFYKKLTSAGVTVESSAANGIPFDNAERLIYKICHERIGTVCFWNLDPRLKLLLVKALGFTKVRFVDVSPGDNSFTEMKEIVEFQQLASFSAEEFYNRLDCLTMKYNGEFPDDFKGMRRVIVNGVPEPRAVKSTYGLHDRVRILVNGRISPTKYLLEIIEAVHMVREKHSQVELHVYGNTEPHYREYLDQVLTKAGQELKQSIHFHGVHYEAHELAHQYDAFVVLGLYQGCPNALLEALAAGLPCIANDNGGTREQIIHNETGILIPDRSPKQLTEAITRVIEDRNFAKHLGKNGREHVTTAFPMERMTQEYMDLFQTLSN